MDNKSTLEIQRACSTHRIAYVNNIMKLSLPRYSLETLMGNCTVILNWGKFNDAFRSLKALLQFSISMMAPHLHVLRKNMEKLESVIVFCLHSSI